MRVHTHASKHQSGTTLYIQLSDTFSIDKPADRRLPNEPPPLRRYALYVYPIAPPSHPHVVLNPRSISGPRSVRSLHTCGKRYSGHNYLSMRSTESRKSNSIAWLAS
jgi:hypothetical protein